MNICCKLGLALIVTGAAAAGFAQKPVKRTESIQLTATVESIDQSTRTLVLKGDESGERAVVVAGPDVRNLEEVKAGDKVLLTYQIGVAAQVKPRGTPASEAEESVQSERAQPGQPPSGSVGRTVSATVKIDSVDTSFNTVTFKRADGVTRVVGVDSPEGQRFIRTLKPGDSVEISYNEALALKVEPAGPKPLAGK